jgi:erythrocyte band 7 integral membrane protein
MLVIGLPFTLCCCMTVVQEYQRAVLFRLGRIVGGGKGPGLFFTLPCIDTMVNVDLRTITFDVPPQEILTKDSVTVTVDAVVYFRIFDPVASVINVENAQKSTRLLAATTLRNILGTKTLQDILQDRESLAHHMQEILDDATDVWV